MANKERVKPSREQEPQSNRAANRRLFAGSDQRGRAVEAATGVPEQHPLHRLQHQVGNAQLARALASASEPPIPMAEVGLAGGPVSNRLASRIYSSLGRGKPLGEQNRARWENAYGVPLDAVRVHNDAEADALSLSVSASAFTLGNDIFLSQQAGAADQHLLGHEIAHVVQQRVAPDGAPSGGPLVVGAADAAPEQEAEAAAREASANLPLIDAMTGTRA